MITSLEPDILECEVKWALGCITTSKASGVDGTAVELFQILKDYAVKALHWICQQIWKTQQCSQDWKGQFSSQSQRIIYILRALSRVRPSVTLWTVYIAHQAPPSMGFFRQEYWSEVAMSFSRGFSWPRDRTQVSHITGRLSHQGIPKKGNGKECSKYRIIALISHTSK